MNKNIGFEFNPTKLVDEPMKSQRTPKAPFPLRLVMGWTATYTLSHVI